MSKDPIDNMREQIKEEAWMFAKFINKIPLQDLETPMNPIVAESINQFADELMVKIKQMIVDKLNSHDKEVIKELDGILFVDKDTKEVIDEADSEWNEAINFAIEKIEQLSKENQSE